MDEIILESGSALKVTPLPFMEAVEIKQSVADELTKIEVDLSGIDLLKLRDTDVIRFSKPLLQILSNKKIAQAAQKCFKRCTYNGIRIDENTFEDVKARQDYLPCAFHALKENLSPFFASLVSSLKKS